MNNGKLSTKVSENLLQYINLNMHDFILEQMKYVIWMRRSIHLSLRELSIAQSAIQTQDLENIS